MTNFSQTRYSYLGDLSLLPLFAAFLCISITCTVRTVLARVEPPEPRPAAEILLGIGGLSGFSTAGSKFVSIVRRARMVSTRDKWI
jgi:hypothetical protein